MIRIYEYLKTVEYIQNENDILSESSIYLEKEIDDNLLVVDLNETSLKIQFNLNENYFFENLEEIFKNYFQGKYIVKNYCYNDSLLYSKFIWKEKKLRKNNFKTKYCVLRCKKINEIEIMQGIPW